MTMLEDVFSWVNIQERIFYTEAALTIPAGESVQVEAALPKEASFDFAWRPHGEPGHLRL